MTEQKKYCIRFLASVQVLGMAEMQAETEDEAKAKALLFLNDNLRFLEATLEIPKQVENENNIKITELDYGDNVEKVEIDAVAELEKDGSMSDKNALKFVTAD